MNSKIKVILIPGNGGATPKDNWFPYIKNKLEKIGIQVINKQFPDPILAREEYWLPFIKKLGANKNTILIGHSSGAIAALRFAENHKIYGSILVSAYYTDLNLEDEKQSGYFNRPWNWSRIKNNQNWIIQFASKDDPFIPLKEARYLHKKLGTEYHEFKNEGHFGTGKNPKLIFPDIINIIRSKIKNL